MFLHPHALRSTLRRFGRSKLTTALHVTGLVLGMSVCLMIGLFLRHELSFDTYHAKADRTYRVNSVWTILGEERLHYSTPFPMAAALRAEVPNLENVVLVHPDRDAIVEINPEERFVQENVLLTEPEFLEVFDVEVLEGNGHAALRTPYQALLTESTARKFFGRENAVGKTFTYKNNLTITVGGIIRDLPGNTHLPASMLISYAPDPNLLHNDPVPWSFVSGTSTYVVLPEGTAPGSVQSIISDLYDKNDVDPGRPEGSSSGTALQPLRDIHFQPEWEGGGALVKAVNPTWLWFFGLVGLAVLALAVINFVNLSTAQSLTRAREVGVRKAIGAGRSQLIGQFLSEAWLLALVSGILAIAAVQASLPAINRLVDKQISFDLLHSPGLLLALLAGIALTGLLAGLYPAWAIARFQPVDTLKTGLNVTHQGSAGLRKALVVMQFTISVGLLIALLLIGQQMQFLRTKNLGFTKDHIITLEVPDRDQRELFAARLSELPQVRDFAFSSTSLSSNGHWATNMSLTDRNDPDQQPVTLLLTDHRFAPMYGLQLLAGRLPEAADTNSADLSLPTEQVVPDVVVNETLVKTLGFASPEAALDQRFWSGFAGWRLRIVGVVADFNTTSLHQAVESTVIIPLPREAHSVGIQLRPDADVPATLAALRDAWESTFPEGVYDYSFMDEDIDAYYKAEERLFRLFEIFAGLAMLISCLGLWGLTTFAAQQRVKEIGIRKVLGASVEGIVALLSRDFLVLVALAIVLAVPLAYYGMQRWLENFAYHIELRWWVFALAGVLALLIAFLTVSVQSLRAALADPASSLRSE